MPETIVYNRAQAGLPYSKGLTAQQLSASGLSPERSYELARVVERRLEEREERGIEASALVDLIEAVVLRRRARARSAASTSGSGSTASTGRSW